MNAGLSQLLNVTFTPNDALDFTTATAQASIDVSPAPLPITTADASMVYGGTPPTLAVSYSGFVNGDMAPSLTTAPSLTAPFTGHVGTDPISASGAVDPNYTISYVLGALTITPASQRLRPKARRWFTAARRRHLPLVTAASSMATHQPA